jgi:ankyrin repeat protein
MNIVTPEGNTLAPAGHATALPILAGAPMDEPNNDGVVPLHLAGTFGHIAALEVPLKQIIVANKQNRAGDSPIHYTTGSQRQLTHWTRRALTST